MYAIIKTGGKQYKVAKGDVLKIEKLPADAATTVNFEEVLLVANGDAIKLGKPLVVGAKVTAEVLEQGKADKVVSIRFKRRKHCLKWRGHRQQFTKIKITEIKG